MPGYSLIINVRTIIGDTLCKLFIYICLYENGWVDSSLKWGAKKGECKFNNKDFWIN